jgi:hypothetical protein
VGSTAEIIEKFIFLTMVCNSAWTVHNGVNVANAAINLGSGTTLHLTQHVGYKTPWFLKSYLTAFSFTCAGVLAGVTATCFTQPFDMLKTRMQLKPLVYRNLWSSAKKVIAVRNGNGV